MPSEFLFWCTIQNYSNIEDIRKNKYMEINFDTDDFLAILPQIREATDELQLTQSVTDDLQTLHNVLLKK